MPVKVLEEKREDKELIHSLLVTTVLSFPLFPLDFNPHGNLLAPL